MNYEFFAIALLIVSTLTGLVTEAVKKLRDERGMATKPNTTAGIISLVLSVALGIAYIIFTAQEFTAQAIITIIALVFLSWLCAMLGYDKVIQTLAQLGVGSRKGGDTR
ncbi:MAG: aminopeptidase [Oscillospiraceae bacterium]|nr:aminopeptidase [Oscillospiraceae bacterium]